VDSLQAVGEPVIKVRDAMSPEAPTATAEGTLLDACRQMHVGGMGAVPVVDAGRRCLGVLSAWDVVRAIGMGAELETTTAAEVVGGDATVHPDDDAERAVDHSAIVTPVIEDGRYVGAVGPGDVQAARALAAALGPDAARVDRTISPGEKMYGGLRGPYLLAGVSALRLLRKAMGLARVSEPPRAVLDLPCGHGRVLRVLRAAFPGATLVACDLDREGVDFCARTFGAVPVYSDADPARVRIEQQVDLVWVGSLFTHLEPARWGGFLDLFAHALRPGGLLVFTTFDRPRQPVLDSMNLPDPKELLRARDARGVAFQSYLHDDGYGITLAGPDHVRSAVSRQFEVLSHEPRAVFLPVPTQDAWLCRQRGA
jgi:CBS domain-containing protein/SAM-dependent methyltransferase